MKYRGKKAKQRMILSYNATALRQIVFSIQIKTRATVLNIIFSWTLNAKRISEFVTSSNSSNEDFPWMSHENNIKIKKLHHYSKFLLFKDLGKNKVQLPLSAFLHLSINPSEENLVSRFCSIYDLSNLSSDYFLQESTIFAFISCSYCKQP